MATQATLHEIPGWYHRCMHFPMRGKPSEKEPWAREAVEEYTSARSCHQKPDKSPVHGIKQSHSFHGPPAEEPPCDRGFEARFRATKGPPSTFGWGLYKLRAQRSWWFCAVLQWGINRILSLRVLRHCHKKEGSAWKHKSEWTAMPRQVQLPYKSLFNDVRPRVRVMQRCEH